MLKIWQFMAWAACCVATLGAGGELPHKWHSEPVTSARMAARIARAAEAASQAQSHAPYLVLYDMGYPHSVREYEDLGGHAVLFIAALTQDQSDLPVRRVYVLEDGQPVDLLELKTMLSEQADRAALAARVFGPFRSDGLYLLPIRLRLKAVDLFIEFSGPSATVKVATFGTPVSSEVAGVLAEAKGEGKLDKDFLTAFVRREYPGFPE